MDNPVSIDQTKQTDFIDPLATGARQPVILIAGGGTGGHIYPGIAIARAIQAQYPHIQVHFVGATGGLEEKIVPRENFPLHTMAVGKLHHSVGLATQLKTLVKLPLTFATAWRLLRKYRPLAVLGVGGFASGPLLFVSSLLGYRSLIWEPNAFPGLTNRLLARRVDECLLVFDEARKHLTARKIVQSGIPVRAEMVPVARTEGARALRILVFGGSQGARFINQLMPQALRDGGWLQRVELVHQTGPHDFAAVNEAYREAPAGMVQTFEYLHDMEARFAWADLVVCRAGASTVAEICACQKAAIFVPLPTAADDHQRKNAEVLSGADAAQVLLQSELNPEKLRAALVRFRDDRLLIKLFETNVRKFQFPHAAEKIVDRLLTGLLVPAESAALKV